MSTLIASPPSVGPLLQPVTLQARLVHKDGSGSTVTDEGEALQQTDFASITCAIYDLDSSTPDTSVSTPTVTVASSILDTLTDDEIWTVDDIGRNFIFTVAGSVFDAEARYRIVFTGTLSSALDDEKIVWAYEHHAKDVVEDDPYRVSEDEVRAIVSSDSLLAIEPFIKMANVLTDRVQTCDTEDDLTTAELEQIELLLSAHFYTLRDPLYTNKRTGDASATFQGKTGMALSSSHYGQMAKTLDVTGCLASMDQRKGKVGFEWLGKPPSDQTDYVDRD